MLFVNINIYIVFKQFPLKFGNRKYGLEGITL